jgi:Predicted transcriptional regulator
MKKSIGQSHSIGTAPRLLTIKQVADRLTVSVGCLRAWRIRGEGPPAIRVGSALRWDEREVDAWLNARRESGGLASEAEYSSRAGWQGQRGDRGPDWP